LEHDLPSFLGIIFGSLPSTFDSRLLKNLDPAAPFMLSGGLNRDDVAVAIEMTEPARAMYRP
jgi:phosphoribosylanthranilate isomerase